MSERLVFELQAIDNATAPLRAVSAQLDETTAATRRVSQQMGSTGKDTRKFAMGALQQAGFQIGDFAVQVANGTNKMQAFGQQAPQMLQIFGPIGAVVGAGVAVFAAFAVAMDKSSAATGRLQEALGKLGETSADLASKLQMIRFGVETPEEAVALQAILDLNSQIVQKTQERNQVYGKARIPLDAELRVLLQQRDSAQSALDLLKRRRGDLGAVAQIEEQINRMNAIRGNAAIEELNDRRRIAESVAQQRMEMGQAQNAQRLMTIDAQKALDKYGKMRTVAAGVANEIQRAADAALNLANRASPSQLAYGGRGTVSDKPVTDQYGNPVPEFFRNRPNPRPVDIDFGLPPEPKGGGGGEKVDPLKELREQLALEEQLVGKTEAEQRVIQALGVDRSKYSAATIAGLVEQINKTDQLNKIQERQAEIADTIKNSMSSAFMSMVDGTKSVTGAFSDMAKSIILKLYEVMVVQQIVNSIMGVVGKAFPSLAPAPVPPHRAMGGPITGGRAYLVGERGPEIVVPSRNGQVVPNNQMASGGVTVVQNINVSTGVQQTVRSEIRSLMPQIAESAKAAVFDAQRRSVNGMGFA